MNPNEKPSFLDRGTILAFIIILVFWFGWSRYMDAKFPQQTPATVATQSGAPETAVQTGAQNASPGATAPADHQPAPPSAQEKLVTYSSPNWSFQISSRGMGLKNVDVKDYKTRDGEALILATAKDHPSFATELLPSEQPVDFQIDQTGPDTFIGHATVDGLQIEKTLKISAPTYSIDSTVHITGVTPNFKGVVTTLDDSLTETVKTGMFSPQADFQTWYVRHDEKNDRKPIHKKDGLVFSSGNSTIAALSAHYFALAVVDHSSILPKFDTKTDAQPDPSKPVVVDGRLMYQPASPGEVFDIKYVAYAGPKLFHVLAKVDDELPRIIDYGTFAVIGRPTLMLLRSIQDVVNNWGFAIIILTILVRLVILPFNLYAYKSMKVMQRLQPEMNKIRERYKDKPADQKLQMNNEIMQLMKTNKASPVGGCLPTLMQLPVLWALYQVLGQSIELYRQPFIFWIHDLSARDPFFVLPVLMGITMFVQQKITPSTMDPQQAKIMMWMPIIFCFFMVSLPSGLTLYFFVSTLFGIIQQYIFMRDRRKTT